LRLKENHPEDKILQHTQGLVEAVEEDRAKKQQESLKRVAEKFIEDIFLGLKQPKSGMQIDIELKGPFMLFGITSTEESSFKYVYPSPNGTEPPENEQPKKQLEDDEELFPII